MPPPLFPILISHISGLGQVPCHFFWEVAFSHPIECSWPGAPPHNPYRALPGLRGLDVFNFLFHPDRSPAHLCPSPTPQAQNVTFAAPSGWKSWGSALARQPALFCPCALISLRCVCWDFLFAVSASMGASSWVVTQPALGLTVHASLWDPACRPG